MSSMRASFHPRTGLPVRRLAVGLFCVLLALAVVHAAIGIPTGTPYSQTFDTIGTTATAALPADFRADRTTTTTSSDMRKVGTFAAAGTATTQVGGASLGSSVTNGIYNFGSGTTPTGPDRAIGFLASSGGTASGNLYAQLTNNTGGPLSGLQISYDVEKYRNGSNAQGFRIQLFYSTDGTSWTNAGSDFLTAFAADANNNGFATAPGATVSVTNKTLSVAIPSNAAFYLAWNYSVSSGSTVTNAQALAIDNVSIVGVPGGDAAPSVSSTTPAASATNVSVNSTIAINFSESVTAWASAFSLECPGGSPQAFTQTASPATTFTLTPTSPLPAGATCAVKVTAAQVTDTDTVDPPDNMVSDYSFTFTTASPADAAPFVTSTTPANGAVNVAVASPIVINFSESVTASPAAFLLVCGGVPQALGQSVGPSASYTLTPTVALPYNASCTVSVAANQISDTDTNDPPDNPTSNVTFSFTTPPPGAGKVMINEVDADTPGSDTAEFVELYDGGVGNTPLDGLVVVFFDGTSTGSGNQSYAVFDLDGYTTDANGYFTMGNPGVPGVSLFFDPGAFGLLQNGPDAVALYIGHASEFPNGTAVTTTNLQDAIVYGTDDPSASGLLPLLNAGQKIVNENATGNSQTQSSQRCPAGMGGFRNTSQYYPGTPTPGTANSCPAQRPASDVVISQIYGGGGNTGATYANDYVELYNRGNAPADLTGWSLQYASSTGSGWDFNKQPLGGTIAPGKYYLIALASGGANGATLPDANISGQINMAAGSGKIALVSSFTTLTGNCPIFDPTIADLVGYGSADCGEGSTTTSAGSNTTALFRKNNGSLDTDNNANDFDAPAAPNPRRTAPIVELGPNVLSTDPRSNGVNAPRDATIQVTFTEPVDVDSGWFTLTCATSGSHYSATFAAGFGGKDHYITPNDNFTAGEQCTVTILKDRVHDQDFDDSAPNTDTLPADYSWVFTVATGTEPPYPASVHLTMGNPTAAGSDPSNYLMEKPEFALSYNKDLGRPNWVSWHLSDEWIGTLTRVDTFRPDPQVPPDWYRVQSFDFSGSGFDRGHMAPNADRDKETSIPINQATFLMSNMVAQAPGANQGPWTKFESYLRTLVEQQDELYIVSGPAGVGGTGSLDGVTTTLAGRHVTVPSATWKVALVLPKASGDDLSRVSCSTQTIAVIMPNQHSIGSDPWQNYLTTVDAVEALTGYNFFSNLPEPYQRCIKAGTNGNNPPLVKGNQTISFPQPPDGTYGGAPFTVYATGGASGNPVTFTASGACASTGSYGATITTLGVGSCTVTASQAGSDIYNAAADVVRTFTINKAAAAIAVTGYSGTYDGAPHGATGSAAGVSGEDLGGLLHLGPTFTNAPGGTAHWTFDGNANYSVASGDVAIEIARATPAFTALSSPTIEAGSASTVIGGTLAFGALVPTGTVAVTLNGVTLNAPVAASGQFSATFVAGSLSVASSPYVVSFAYAGDTNFNGAAGSSSLIVVDTTAPTIDAHANLTAAATSGSGAVVTYAAPLSHDAVDGNVPATCAPASGSTFPLGTTTVTCNATDAHGNAAAAVTFTVTVSDTTAPVLTLAGGNPMTVEAGGTFVDPGATATDTAAGNLTAAIVVSGAVDTAHVGTYQITYTVSDGYNTASVTRTVIVVDTTSPVLSAVSPTESILWPPNHQFITVGLGYTFADNSGAAACSVGVLSNEPVNGTGDGDTAPDWQVIDGTTIQLRAERAGGGSGRVYTISVTCRDASGNTATKSTTVSVPHDKGK
ncbi:MAG: DNA/RNA non-specific endonuclease [Acidobacteria bacterium]|nr:DNA/RNA non-specific endonuclease [Acidobacteriota bacterium]